MNLRALSTYLYCIFALAALSCFGRLALHHKRTRSVYHIVGLKLADPANVPSLIAGFQATLEGCSKPDGGQYIKSIKGGKQVSTEGFDEGVQVVWVIEFESEADLAYYINDDPAHVAFKTSAGGKFGIVGGPALDFVDGVF